MKVAPELIFPGARIQKDGKLFTVIKVNAKSFYATEMTFPEYLAAVESKPKGTTFTAFCKAYNIPQYKYTDGWEIQETEFNRKRVAEENKNSAYKIDKLTQLEIIRIIQLFEKKKKSIRLFMTYAGKKRIVFLERKGNSFLINLDGDYILHSIDTAETIKLCTVYEWNYKEIPWERLSSNSVQQKTA